MASVPTCQAFLAQRKTVPVAFMSRKLTQGQRNWVAREQETYAIILAKMGKLDRAATGTSAD